MIEKELSPLEILKASRNPLRVIEDIYKEAVDGIPLTDEYIGLLKWYGMYPHVNSKNLEDKKENEFIFDLLSHSHISVIREEIALKDNLALQTIEYLLNDSNERFSDNCF